MAPPSSPQIIIPAFKRLVYGVESVAAGTAAASGLTQESCQSIVTAIQRTPYEAREYVGAAADLFGIDMTAQYAQITVSVPFRVNGFAAQALACILGNASDTVSGGATTTVASVTVTAGGSGYTSPPTVGFTGGTGSGAAATAVINNGAVVAVNMTNAGSGYTTPPTGVTFTGGGGTGATATLAMGTAGNYLHNFAPSALTTRCNTLTIWHDTGDRGTGTTPQNILQMTWATVQSVKLTYNPTGALNCEVQMLAQVPTSVAAPTVNNFIGSSANFSGTRVMGYQGQFDIFRGGTTNEYVLPGTTSSHSNMVMSGDMTISRALDPVVTAFNITPQDFVPGPLQVAGSFDLRYDGAGSTSVWSDYLNLQRIGQSTSPNLITYSIDANNGVQLTFQPIKWTGFSLSDQGQQIRAQVQFTGYNDLQTVNTASPAISIITSAVIRNQQSAVMVT